MVRARSVWAVAGASSLTCTVPPPPARAAPLPWLLLRRPSTQTAVLVLVWSGILQCHAHHLAACVDDDDDDDGPAQSIARLQTQTSTSLFSPFLVSAYGKNWYGMLLSWSIDLDRVDFDLLLKLAAPSKAVSVYMQHLACLAFTACSVPVDQRSLDHSIGRPV